MSQTTEGRYVIGPQDAGRRIETILRKMFRATALSSIHKALRSGFIKINDKKATAASRCVSGDILTVPAWMHVEDSPVRLAAKVPAIPESWVILDSPDLLVLNKPRGILVHGSGDSLEAMVRARLGSGTADSLAFTPGPLHRLDRNTSGLIAFSKSLRGAQRFGSALKEKRLEKTYLAIFEGAISEKTTWNDLLSRDRSLKMSLAAGDGSGQLREAIMTVLPILANKTSTLAAVRLETGRTHQIRAQGCLRGHPLEGDAKYGSIRIEHPYYLHAWRLRAPDLGLDSTPFEVHAPLPEDFFSYVTACYKHDRADVYSLLESLLAPGGIIDGRSRL